MFTGSVAQLFCVLVWMQAPNFALTQISCVLAGYCSASWIASCCYGKYLLSSEYYLLYYVCVGYAFSLGQFIATLMESLALASIIDLSQPHFLLAVVTSALASLVCFACVPNRNVRVHPAGCLIPRSERSLVLVPTELAVLASTRIAHQELAAGLFDDLVYIGIWVPLKHRGDDHGRFYRGLRQWL